MMNYHDAPQSCSAILAVTAALALTLAAGAAAAQTAGTSTCASGGDASVAALSRDGLLVGWERRAGDGPLDFREKLGKYYDWSASDVIIYDDFDPEHRIVRSPAVYGAIWEPSFSALRTAHHRFALAPSILLSSDLAVATLQFIVRLEGKDGKVTGIRVFTSLAWRCTGDGWKIVREHNSSVVLPADQVDAVMSAASDN